MSTIVSTIIAMISALTLVLSVQIALIPLRIGAQKLPLLWVQDGFLVLAGIALVTVSISAALEAVFIFAIPACILEQISWMRAIRRSFKVGIRSYGPIFLTILGVSLCYLPFLLLRYGTRELATSSWPESVLVLYLIRILVSWIFGALFAVWATTYLVRHAEVRR